MAEVGVAEGRRLQETAQKTGFHRLVQVSLPEQDLGQKPNERSDSGLLAHPTLF